MYRVYLIDVTSRISVYSSLLRCLVNRKWRSYQHNVVGLLFFVFLGVLVVKFRNVSKQRHGKSVMEEIVKCLNEIGPVVSVGLLPYKRPTSRFIYIDEQLICRPM